VIINVRGLAEIVDKFRNHHRKLYMVYRVTLQAMLLFLWSKVPSYPIYTSDYVRTGTLGRSMGVSEGGGQAGQPDIYEVRQNGGHFESHFGTRLEYAQYVIGDRQEEQASHMRHWWTIPQDLLSAAYDGILNLANIMVEELAAWYERKGE
jgi:hypothetical protein